MGKLYCVSSGPGDSALITPKAIAALECCSEFVGIWLLF